MALQSNMYPPPFPVGSFGMPFLYAKLRTLTVSRLPSSPSVNCFMLTSRMSNSLRYGYSVYGFCRRLRRLAIANGHALHEVRLFFEITAESICSEYLECAEENEMTQALEEFLTSDWEIFVERL